MSIIIDNVSTHDDMLGSNEYIVRINNQEVARFAHFRGEGLASCLRRAATAVERSREVMIQRAVKAYGDRP